jgi:hypothetical protein
MRSSHGQALQKPQRSLHRGETGGDVIGLCAAKFCHGVCKRRSL